MERPLLYDEGDVLYWLRERLRQWVAEQPERLDDRAVETLENDLCHIAGEGMKASVGWADQRRF